jgi:hypothetical protein
MLAVSGFAPVSTQHSIGMQHQSKIIGISISISSRELALLQACSEGVTQRQIFVATPGPALAQLYLSGWMA